MDQKYSSLDMKQLDTVFYSLHRTTMFCTLPRVSHQNKMFEDTLPDLTTFVLG